MRSIDGEIIKKIELEILLNVTSFCEKNNLGYYLCYGTLLGAVRHNGFIPWDDDIDISMPRSDYEKFLSIYSDENYELFHWKRSNKCLCTFAKVFDNRTVLIENGDYGELYGVNIDIFPDDGVPDTKRKIKKHVSKMKFLWGLVVCGTIKDISLRKPTKKLAIWLGRAFFKVIPIKHYITGRVIENAKKYQYDTSEYAGHLVWGYGEREIVRRSWISEYTKVEFEGYSLNAPKHYDEYLTQIYGDYMTPPPMEKRQYNHGLKAYWKDDQDQ